ncbi:hypothetical protein P7D68_06340 [Enterococcus avium]|uniref:hypothetical protein n=1 Tax=Enterococcus avium TaxID=33945 RepID=UPI00288E9D62|nr:hypothetical protein [Enterococcus avium]MDT2469811.1 hypothetical protein [Enterococcus avium]
MEQIEDKVILTQSELQAMLREAATLGKFKPTVESHLFNTNQLFQTEQSNFKNRVKEIQLSNGFVRYERWGLMPIVNANDLHELVRKLVLKSFIAESNKGIPIEKRIAAKQLYTDLSNLFLSQFEQTCDSE